MIIPDSAKTCAQDLLNFIDDSPSPWHVVLTTKEKLINHGYQQLNERDLWQLQKGQGYFVTRGGSSIIAFKLGLDDLTKSGMRIIGAHTDSPGLRLKPKTSFASDGYGRIGVEVYGSPILATFTDRDLSLAGRVNIRTEQGFETKAIQFDRPLLRLPNLAIHMNREVNEHGLKLNKQTELPLILSMLENSVNTDESFISLLSQAANAKTESIINWELNVFDTQNGNFWGANQEFIADSQLDNLASCHAALTALIATDTSNSTNLCAFFDHEEVGSQSAAGAGGSFLADVLQRISDHLALSSESKRQVLAQSFFISTDMAHAYHPNFPAAYEPCHHALVNHGPVIKINANQRYSTDAETAAQFIQHCEHANVPYQQYAHRTDLGCGSTIGPIVAANLGIASVDVGSPMWAMHSLRESAGVLDHEYMIKVLKEIFTN
jgi:aspartyl aminopeptidase